MIFSFFCAGIGLQNGELHLLLALTEEVLGYIPELGEVNEVHEITDLRKKFDMLEKRVTAFEETVFAGSHATPQTNQRDVIRGRLAVSQRAAENRASSTSRSSSCGE